MDYISFTIFALATFVALLLANGHRWALLGIVPIAIAAPVVVFVTRAGIHNRVTLVPLLLGIACGSLAHWLLAFVYHRNVARRAPRAATTSTVHQTAAIEPEGDSVPTSPAPEVKQTPKATTAVKPAIGKATATTAGSAPLAKSTAAKAATKSAPKPAAAGAAAPAPAYSASPDDDAPRPRRAPERDAIDTRPKPDMSNVRWPKVR